jgi:hypothetical protein
MQCFAADYPVQSGFCILVRFLYDALDKTDGNVEDGNKLAQVCEKLLQIQSIWITAPP